MLARTNRLNRTAFSEFFKTGRRYHTSSLTLIYAPSPTFHASAVISKKVSKKAVARNKFRRRVYDVFERLHREGLSHGVFITIAKENASQLSYPLLKAELHELIHKTGVLS